MFEHGCVNAWSIVDRSAALQASSTAYATHGRPRQSLLASPGTLARQQLWVGDDQRGTRGRHRIGNGACDHVRTIRKTLPLGYTLEWSGTAYQEQATGGQTGIVLGLAVLFAFLFLVGLYESCIIPCSCP